MISLVDALAGLDAEQRAHICHVVVERVPESGEYQLRITDARWIAEPEGGAEPEQIRDGVQLLEWTRYPDVVIPLGPASPEEIEDAIRDLNRSRLLGHGDLEAARFDANDPGHPLAPQYPQWHIVPPHYRGARYRERLRARHAMEEESPGGAA
jgi:hypothetical protein